MPIETNIRHEDLTRRKDLEEFVNHNLGRVDLNSTADCAIDTFLTLIRRLLTKHSPTFSSSASYSYAERTIPENEIFTFAKEMFLSVEVMNNVLMRFLSNTLATKTRTHKDFVYNRQWRYITLPHFVVKFVRVVDVNVTTGNNGVEHQFVEVKTPDGIERKYPFIDFLLHYEPNPLVESVVNTAVPSTSTAKPPVSAHTTVPHNSIWTLNNTDVVIVGVETKENQEPADNEIIYTSRSAVRQRMKRSDFVNQASIVYKSYTQHADKSWANIIKNSSEPEAQHSHYYMDEYYD